MCWPCPGSMPCTCCASRVVFGTILVVDLRLLGLVRPRPRGHRRFARDAAPDLGRLHRRCRDWRAVSSLPTRRPTGSTPPSVSRCWPSCWPASTCWCSSSCHPSRRGGLGSQRAHAARPRSWPACCPSSSGPRVLVLGRLIGFTKGVDVSKCPRTSTSTSVDGRSALCRVQQQLHLRRYQAATENQP